MPARIGQTFEPRGIIYPVAEMSPFFDDGIAHADANPKIDAAGVRHTCITVSYMVLPLSGAS
jgi:hypothetical protein